MLCDDGAGDTGCDGVYHWPRACCDWTPSEAPSAALALFCWASGASNQNVGHGFMTEGSCPPPPSKLSSGHRVWRELQLAASQRPSWNLSVPMCLACDMAQNASWTSADPALRM